MKVEVTVSDIVRSLTKGVITQRVAVRKLEALITKETAATLAEIDSQLKANREHIVVHTDNL
jgi:hypothetical protein